MKIVNVTDATIDRCFAFLKKHEDSAQFLINNLREHGPKLTAHHNSGNFKMVTAADEMVGVFCLTRRGNLNAQLEVNRVEASCTEAIIESLKSEPIMLKGFIGDWPSIEPILTLYRKLHPDYAPAYESKEILYSYQLNPTDQKLQHDHRVRFLEERDFPQWLVFSKAYMAELSIPDELSDEQKRSDFAKQIKNQVWWGLFQGDSLQSRVALNSKGESVGQVGGVYTPPNLRQRGLAKAAMFHMLKDCRDLHHHTKSILFTGETDLPAQKLYQSMGYKRIGSFALVLS